MNKLIIIGNGFDLGHGLKTRFGDFIETNPIFATRYASFRKGDCNWNEVESQFKWLILSSLERNSGCVEVSEKVQEIIDSYGINDYGEVDYYVRDSDAFAHEINDTQPLVALLKDFETNFLNYLKSMYNDSDVKKGSHPRKSFQRLFDSTSRVISFNYTNVVELLYGFTRVEHIHGTINSEIAIGCDTFDRITKSLVDGEYPRVDSFDKSKDGMIDRMTYYDYDMEDNLVVREPVRRLFGDVFSGAISNEKKLIQLLRAQSKEFVAERKRIINSLSETVYDEAIIIGHSMGKADQSIFESIKSKKVLCYFHGETDRCSKELYIEKKFLNFILVSDEQLYE